MKREKGWGQDDPMTQLRVILGSIEGDLLNIVDGHASVEAPSRALRHVKDAQRLATAIAKGDTKWDAQAVVVRLQEPEGPLTNE